MLAKALERNTSLQDLNLSLNKIRGVGVKSLMDSLSTVRGGTQLCSLSMHGCQTVNPNEKADLDELFAGNKKWNLAHECVPEDVSDGGSSAEEEDNEEDGEGGEDGEEWEGEEGEEREEGEEVPVGEGEVPLTPRGRGEKTPKKEGGANPDKVGARTFTVGPEGPEANAEEQPIA
jgi:hypothetical protein